MNKQHFIELAEYTVWANGIAYNWLEKISDEQWKQEVKSSFPSIYATVLHTAAADKIWVQRLSNATKFENLTETFKGSPQELLQVWKKGMQDFEQFIKEFNEDKLDEKLAFKNIKGIPHNQPYWQLFSHVINHATYHRGQLVTMLREVGYTEFTSTDMTTYFRTKYNL